MSFRDIPTPTATISDKKNLGVTVSFESDDDEIAAFSLDADGSLYNDNYHIKMREQCLT
jgi:hypothetical protein